MTTTADDMEIAVTVPDGPSHIVTADGVSHLVEIDANGSRYVKIKAKHAHTIINGGIPFRASLRPISNCGDDTICLVVIRTVGT